ncbi:MAG: helix-turn-helix transcriptional regulator, partial [bacterium]|nr:helix-turn-helix transcriptional regulator [bacterium]
MGPTQRLLEAAAAETRERIRLDRERVPPQIQPLLAYLEEHLFDPDLDANQLKRACGVRDHSLPVHFHNALDLPPYAYIEDCRLQTACRLLRDSNLKVWQVAQMLGYSTLQVFSRAFHRWSGVRPSRFRQKERQRVEQEQAGRQSVLQRRRPPVSFTPDDPLIRLETMRRAVNGGLEKDEADALSHRLCDLYPESFQGTASGVPDAGHETSHAAVARIPLVPHSEHHPLSPPLPAELRASEEAERSKAEEAWQELKDRSWKEQWELIQDQFRFSSAALFHLLREKSREEGRIDRWRGVRLAELALESLFGIDEVIGADTLSNWQAQGWAWIGNARRLAFDYPGAEKAFIRAEWCLPSADRNPLVEAELLQNKAALRWFQHRTEEAIELVGRA